MDDFDLVPETDQKFVYQEYYRIIKERYDGQKETLHGLKRQVDPSIYQEAENNMA